MRKIIIKTRKTKEVINITPQVEKLLEKYPAKDGLLHLFLRHTTAALTTAYIEEDLNLDLIGAYEVMIPYNVPRFLHEAGEHTHHIGHLPAHIVGSLLGPHLAIPIEKNKLKLGTFQSLVLVELNGPRERAIIVDYAERPRWEK